MEKLHTEPGLNLFILNKLVRNLNSLFDNQVRIEVGRYIPGGLIIPNKYRPTKIEAIGEYPMLQYPPVIPGHRNV